MYTPDLTTTSNLRPGDDVQADICAAIWETSTIRSTDMHSLSITVQDGVVVLEGHMSGTFNRQRVEKIARAVPGVVAVRNQVVVDVELDLAVAQALARDARTRPYLLPVGSYHGWVRLGGAVDNREVQAAAEAVAARVPSVRGVVGLPRVAGEPPALRRRPVQPHIGAQVYDGNGRAGVVALVVINPQNRLVTHVVVSASGMVDTDDVNGFKPVMGDYLVSVEAAEVVSEQSVILVPQPPSITVYPLFDASAYPPAPRVAAWRPPYPYNRMPGTVRWFPPQPQTAPAAEPLPAMDWPVAASSADINSSLWSKAKARPTAARQHA
jgi:osmotically-inducible protein OsmY